MRPREWEKGEREKEKGLGEGERRDVSSHFVILEKLQVHVQQSSSNWKTKCNDYMYVMITGFQTQ